MKVYKNDFVERLATTADITKSDAEYVYDMFLKVLTDSLVAGDEIYMKGFGIYSIKEIRTRTGVGPKNKEAIVVPAHKSVKFKCGKTLKRLVNEGVE